MSDMPILTRRRIEAEFAQGIYNEMIPTPGTADSSGHSRGWYRARGWPAAARKAKTHADPR